MFNRLIGGLRSLFRKAAVERELDAELRFHMECQIEENIRKGMNQQDAELAARKKFGNVTNIKEQCRETSSIRLLEDLWQDIQYGFRVLTKSPIYTLVAIITLALGIGANSAIFSVIYGVLIRPLPYEKGEDLVFLRQQAPLAKVDSMGFSPTEVEDFRKANHTLVDIAEHHTMSFILLGKDEPEQVKTAVVSANFFDLLGVKPLMGRAFQPADDQQGAQAVLILSYNYWQQNHNGDANIIGKVFKMNDRPHTVIGVLPHIPQYPVESDVYMPTSACPTRSSERIRTNRTSRMVDVFGRLKPGVTLEQADSDLKTIAASLQQEYPDAYPKSSGYVTAINRLQEQLTDGAKPPLLILLATAMFVLLIACANVANLALARLMSREREIAVRKAMGASRGRLIRQLITESIILTTVAGGIGLLLAASGLHLLVDFAAKFTNRAGEIEMNGSVLIFTLVVSLLTGIIFGLLPAFLPEKSLLTVLKEGNSRASAGLRWQRLRGALLIAQVSFCFVLLIGAGLMMRSLLKLQKVNPGFNAENVLAITIRPNWSKYIFPQEERPQKYRALYRRLLEDVKNHPGVKFAAMATTYPLDKTAIAFGPANNTFIIENRPLSEKDPVPQADGRIVSVDYFQTIQLPLIAGRYFTDADNEQAPLVAIINNSLAKHRWGNEDPLGKRVSFDDGKTWATIVGIVGDVKQYGLNKEVTDEMYGTLAQSPGAGNLLVRTSTNPKFLSNQLRKVLYNSEPEMAIPEIQTLSSVVDDSMASPRLMTILLALFAGLALIITVTGITGVMALMATQRTHEIGIRMALGANQADILWLIMKQGVGFIIAGLTIGIVAAIALTRLMSTILFAVEPTDPATFLIVSLLLITCAAMACLVPARRATLIDPIKVLKND